MQTSILDRMNGSLCDALTGQGDGRAMLEDLDKRNLFLVPLDDRRRWYRYHHLFADVLQARLLDEQPGRVPELHRLASDWHEANGDRAEAIRHAMAGAGLRGRGRPGGAGDAGPAPGSTRGDAAGLAGDAARATCSGSGRCSAWALAGTRLSTGTIEGVESLLLDAQRWLDDAPRTDMVVVDHEAFRRLPADVAVHRAGLALMHGDVDSTVVFAPERAGRSRWTTTSSRGRGLRPDRAGRLGHGDLETAYTSYAESVRHVRADRAHRRRARLLDHAGRPAADPGRLRAAMRHLRPRAAARRRPGGCGAARDGGHARGQERAPLRARRPGRRPAGARAQRSSSGSTTGCRRTPIAAGW